jgi:hypothetical protein
MKLFSIIIFLLFLTIPFISNAQEKCKTNYECSDSPYCGDDMTCFCSEGICKYGPGPTISNSSNSSNSSISSKNNTNTTLSLSLRGSYDIN